MAEVEFAGVKFKGGRMVAVVMALTTLGGFIFAGAEAYARWVAMEKKINSYVSPDLSGFDKRIAIIQKQLRASTVRVSEIQTIARDIRQDTRADAASLHNAMSAVDKRSRTADAETRAAMRQAEKVLRDITSSASERFDSKINSVDQKLDTLEKRLQKQLQRALDNPLLKR
jgi:flagellar hook-basal body complex protein FliE